MALLLNMEKVVPESRVNVTWFGACVALLDVNVGIWRHRLATKN